ncbi:unnamed protein product [Rhizoctonia solani]|uniref:Amidase domain-containing protein n=1 Tax=Rhizoctonia solani TaxID=456999 RepID=A0A8H3CUG0_9AGAM|nr:unnamed protein product [Rhizoctonia solani]
MGNDQPTWQIAAARKREDRASRLEPYDHWSLNHLAPPSQKNVTSLAHARLTDRERTFLASDVTDLAHRLATQECTALEVTTAFCKATYAAQELTNCVTGVMFAQALDRARELDAHLSETGKVVGPLHGVPVSIKNHISVKGEDTACGYVAWIGKVAEDDATIVRVLRAAGAVIYVKTTNPQALYALETSSNIYGLTTNPYNRDLSSGGSSGGEGALIGSRASLLGVGTDIGGSIVSSKHRLMSLENMTDICASRAWCGLYALKPSGYRLPSSGLVTPYQGQEDIALITGPLAHSIRDLELFCRVILGYQPWNIDVNALSIPWNQSLAESGSEKLVVGLFTDDGIVAPHPPLVECLQNARDALVAAGHEVIDWVPVDHTPGIELLVKYYGMDGGEALRAPLVESGEPAIPLIQDLLDIVQGTTNHHVSESWATNIKRDQIRARVLKQWNETSSQSKSGRPIDAILCPTTATLAAPHGTTKWAGYSNYWNLLDLPAAVFPVDVFDAKRWKSGVHLPPPVPRNPIEELVASQWDPDKYDGSPIGLQLVGQRWQEETLIAHLRVVDAVVNRSNKASG